MKALPAFSRAQVGILILLGLFLWWWGGGSTSTGGAGARPEPMPAPVFIEVTGKAAHPGVYEFSAPPGLQEVWRRAGGPEPRPGDNPTLTSGTVVEMRETGAYRVARMSGARLLTLGLPLPINLASPEDLEALPGVGPQLARRLVEHRQRHGPFRRPADLTEVAGVGLQMMTRLTPYLSFEAGEPGGSGKTRP